MTSKATILVLAREQALEPQIVEKDYALSWLLYGIAQHPVLSRWRFKGGTCLKKCFFDTYRFSEDLDFTIPRDVELTESSLRTWLAEVCEWVSQHCESIEFDAERLDVEPHPDKQGQEAFTIRAYYAGPLGLASKSRQRIKLDLTQHEILCDPPDMRAVFHGYEDRIEPAPSIACYSINEILAEKTRALYQREGRARDVYDVVNIHRTFRERIDPARARAILREKFAFKSLPAPSVQNILERVDLELLATAWQQQLSRQLPILPPFESFSVELRDALAWWMEPETATPQPPRAPLRPGEEVRPRELFAGTSQLTPVGGRTRLAPRRGSSPQALLDRAKFAARNRLLAEISYDGATRVVEPYSLRYARSTGNTSLFVHELSKNGVTTNQLKSYDITKLWSVEITNRPFTPRWTIEL
jgi:predicted nucleotidyltransferase component of viral defense system